MSSTVNIYDARARLSALLVMGHSFLRPRQEGPSGVLSAGVVESGFDILTARWSHAVRSGELDPHHADQFDRLLIAQADVEDVTLVCREGQMRTKDGWTPSARRSYSVGQA